jgi:hypothetical protein
MPVKTTLEVALYALVERKVYGVEKRSAEGADCVTSEDTFYSFEFECFVDRRQSMRVDPLAALQAGELKRVLPGCACEFLLLQEGSRL